MSDMGEVFSKLRELRKQKRESNTTHSTKLLIERGIRFQSKNGGAHLIIEDRVDFWPSTGLYIERKSGARGRGVANLLRLLKK